MRIKYRFTDRTDAGYTQAQYWQKWNPFSYLRYEFVGISHSSSITMEQRHQWIRKMIIDKVNYKKFKDRTGEFTL